MELKWWIIFGMIALLILSLAAALYIKSQESEKCLVWQTVNEKINQENLQSSDYNLALNESNLLIPVDKDTYDWVKVGQSYNFYCSKGVFREWKCSASYECAEMHWG